MTDLGFGLADRRSILVVLFVFIISSLVFGNPFPVDSSSATSLFIGLIILTGFIYISRTVFRIFITTVYGLVFIPHEIFIAYKSKATFDINDPPSNSNSDYLKNKHKSFIGYFNKLKIWKKISIITAIILEGLRESFHNRLFLPLLIERDWNWNPYRYDLIFLGVLDRVFLIAISYIATLPAIIPERQKIGLFGIGFLLLIYIVGGSFTLILVDGFRKAEEDHQELVRASANPNFPTTITTRSEDRHMYDP